MATTDGTERSQVTAPMWLFPDEHLIMIMTARAPADTAKAHGVSDSISLSTLSLHFNILESTSCLAFNMSNKRKLVIVKHRMLVCFSFEFFQLNVT